MKFILLAWQNDCEVYGSGVVEWVFGGSGGEKTGINSVARIILQSYNFQNVSFWIDE